MKMQADGKHNEFMPKVDMKDMKSLDVMFMKQAEEINLRRSLRYQKIRRSNIIGGTSLALGVLGIYFYSMYAVKQETFLDDFNEPETVIEQNN
ncbi:cytochrome c oxidase assembly factor 3, mitochondrial isoform X1 [Hylaeus volcanicus]|uniref:cytochrome c oxidase assembly factor 3, mitochondrial isoform X1 n=2 Tax=Hylaeus volcanicus TaxID=313075 RepID=UPI0023B77A3C|nr:cytochrome c oxidase assembly factor 3, mitochondrial isoform X1 [Hylaeus volcanicus]